MINSKEFSGENVPTETMNSSSDPFFDVPSLCTAHKELSGKNPVLHNLVSSGLVYSI